MIYWLKKSSENLLNVLYENNWINFVIADKSKTLIMYKELFLKSKRIWKDTFMNYSNSTIRLDHFYRDLLNNLVDFLEIWMIVKLVLILSHSNATVKSVLSINKDMLV